MSVRPVLIIAASLLLAGCGGPLEVSDVTAESDAIRYFPAVMRDFPVWQPVDTPRYDFEVRDGARKPSGGLRYRSGLPAKEIADLFLAHAASIDCEVTYSDQTQSLADCGGTSARGLELHVNAATEEGRDIVVLFLATTPEFEKVSF
ncbi:hypothetical protein [Roseibium sp. Sym1]|uniref:hypothetical protein n=1 Tax=Roseibium sp. Sym1 TaxID=3016006 RepID=UPI0022B4B9BC|nr:hypothetical protein [Roseibium sp. Sym1]